MAKLSSNGETLVEMICERKRTDGADADAMTLRQRVTRRAMASGFVLAKTDTWTDFGLGNGETYHPGTWTRAGKIKAHLLSNRQALFGAMQEWADKLRGLGWEAEITQ